MLLAIMLGIIIGCGAESWKTAIFAPAIGIAAFSFIGFALWHEPWDTYATCFETAAHWSVAALLGGCAGFGLGAEDRKPKKNWASREMGGN